MHSQIQLAGMIGGQEIFIILLVVLIFFGGKKIPELMKGLGKGMREYKRAVSGLEDELSDEKPKTQEYAAQNNLSLAATETGNS
ncbi:MAG: twin-arginine translocase TatA/TatE family subunit [Bacteroidales bacterium]|nr:twin-arginine translocase TatA/TatE family subunit [Bacteroidales bacterium]